MADQPPRARRSLAGDYLEQAVDALHATGSPDMLYGHRRDSRDPFVHALLTWDAPGKRLQYARTAILFAAIAAEAYVNAYILTPGRFSGPDASAMDRLPTVDKLVLAPRLEGDLIFERGREPVTTLKALFKLRNDLVHPKPELEAARLAPPDEPHGYDRTNPEVAARAIVAVARAGVELTAPDGSIELRASMFDDGRNLLLTYGKQARQRLPKATDPPSDPLYEVLIREVERRAPKKGDKLG